MTIDDCLDTCDRDKELAQLCGELASKINAELKPPVNVFFRDEIVESFGDLVLFFGERMGYFYNQKELVDSILLAQGFPGPGDRPRNFCLPTTAPFSRLLPNGTPQVVAHSHQIGG